jgi:hypothetical protein
VVWEPRAGIAWKPFNNDQTVIRAGAGVFADEFMGLQAEYAAFNSPGFNAFTVPGATGVPLAPGVPGGLFSSATQANQALLTQFHSGGSFNSISQALPVFSAPNFYNFPSFFPNPEYYKWNFQVEQALGAKTLLSVNYAGMHGIHVPVGLGNINAFCPPSVCLNGFAGLPSEAPNPAFSTMTQFLSAGTANYNGLTVSLQRRLAAGISFNVNYAYSHALDDVSNGGIQGFGVSGLVTDGSLLQPQNPNNIRGNYGSSDYDVRHYFSATVMVTDMFRRAGFHWGPKRVFGGWTFSSNWFLRSGLPFTIVDNSATDTLAGYNYNTAWAAITATPVGAVSHSCTSAVNSPCLSTSQFAPSVAVTGVPTGFGTMGRNSIYGPHFFDVDMALTKNIAITEHVTFSFGAQAYNVFNHPNFDQPVSDISDPQFGSSISAVSPPTSILGSFVGAGASPRFLEIRGTLRF